MSNEEKVKRVITYINEFGFNYGLIQEKDVYELSLQEVVDNIVLMNNLICHIKNILEYTE